VVNPLGAPDAYLEGAGTRHGPLSRDAGPRAVLNALDRLAGTYESQAATARKDLVIAGGQLRDYQARLGQPFVYDAYVTELTGLRDQLKAALAQATPEPGTPPVAPATIAPAGNAEPLLITFPGIGTAQPAGRPTSPHRDRVAGEKRRQALQMSLF
jgi:hypothetical protein